MPFIPRLGEVMFKGFFSGLRWETKGYKTYDAESNTLIHMHHNLLFNQHSTHISKVLSRHLGTRSKKVIGECLSDIYNLAADNVHLCGRMEPEKFWSYAKNSWEWSANFRDEAFLAFTYKLLHARALYLASVPRTHHPEGHALIDALDRFVDCFYDLYDPESAINPILRVHRTQEAIEDVEDEMFLMRETCHAYFQYAQASSEGDGRDRLISTVITEGQNPELDPNEYKYAPTEEPPAEFTEDTLGFYIDLGPRNPRHGHKDAYQEIEEALKKADEEEEQAKRQEAEATGLEDDMMMMDVDQEEDNIGDVGFGRLGI
ncbi:hypothetical protein F5Y10DRAFT_287849 [Nemania abortiva]|nr:hypothetical protein F5Y10DRAFT_287849 [Nemania abortiva]